MTHTFTKNADGTFDVGNWLLSFHRPGTHQFSPLIRVKHLMSAIRLTNLLNGGTGNIEAALLRAGVMTDIGVNDGAEMHDDAVAGPKLVR